MRVSVLFAATLSLAVGCSNDTPAAPVVPVGVGTLPLARINGHALPTSLSASIVTGGFLALDPDGTYTREQRDSTPTATGGWERAQSQDHGTWTRRGDSLFLATIFATYGYGPGAGAVSATGVTLTTRNARDGASLQMEFSR